MKIEVSNVNVNNDYMIKNIAGSAGYAASIETVNETTIAIDLGDEAHREKAGIRVVDIERMFSLFILAGFTLRKIQ